MPTAFNSQIEEIKGILRSEGSLFIEAIPDGRKFTWKCNKCSKTNKTTTYGFLTRSSRCVCLRNKGHDTDDFHSKIEEIRPILEKEGHVFVSANPSKRGFSWNCQNGHFSHNTSTWGFLKKGSRCKKCQKYPGAPRHYLKPGTKINNQEVIEFIGRIDGKHRSHVRVRNIDNGEERVMTVSAFKRQKSLMLSKAELASLSKTRALARGKGFKNPKKAKYTFGYVKKLCADVGMEFLADPRDEEVVYDTKSVGVWHIKCFCGRIFSPQLNSLLMGDRRSCGCVKSRPQIEIDEWIRSLGLSTVFNDRKALDGLELDIYIPELNMAIEHDGLYWHSELLAEEIQKSPKASYLKYKACKEKGIRLITIFEDEWLDIQDKVKGYLSSIFNKKITKTVGARKLSLSKEKSKDVRTFLKENHLQGASNGLSYSLKDDEGQILAVAVFAKPNASRNSKRDAMELMRYCIKVGYSVPGGLEKILKQFKTDLPECKELVSYSDNRWSAGNIYRRLGFVLESEGTPSYWYFKQGKPPREHRYKWRKSVAIAVFGADPVLTEWEIMKSNGYNRIWDCGASRWALALK